MAFIFIKCSQRSLQYRWIVIFSLEMIFSSSSDNIDDYVLFNTTADNILASTFPDKFDDNVLSCHFSYLPIVFEKKNIYKFNMKKSFTYISIVSLRWMRLFFWRICTKSVIFSNSCGDSYPYMNRSYFNKRQFFKKDTCTILSWCDKNFVVYTMKKCTGNLRVLIKI